MCVIRPADALIRLDAPLIRGRDVYDWLTRTGVEPTASIVNMMLMSGGVIAPLPVIYDCTGADQSYTVPWGARRLRVKLWGAGGAADCGAVGTGGPAPAWGGAGGYVEGDIAVVPGEVLTLVVGRGGIVLSPAVYMYGGGGGVHPSYAPARVAPGGGLAAIKRGSAILGIAGAGGGGSGANTSRDGHGGAGGGTSGEDAGTGVPEAAAGGAGGSQTAGGAGARNSAHAEAGGALVGGRAPLISSWTSIGTAGGGAGYYGGGGGLAGGGGSNWTGGLTGAITSLRGAGTVPPMTSDIHYAAGIALGATCTATTSVNGGNGRIVIIPYAV